MQKFDSEKLMKDIFVIGKFIKGEMNFVSGKEHLTLQQLQALLYIKEHKEAKMQDISEHFNVSKPTATSLLERLVASKLVKRLSDKTDRRVVKVALTDAGEELFKKAEKHRKEKLNQLLQFLSDKDKTDLLRVLDTVSAKLKKAYEK